MNSCRLQYPSWTPGMRKLHPRLQKSQPVSRSRPFLLPRHSSASPSLSPLCPLNSPRFSPTPLGERGGINNAQFSSGRVEFCLGTEEMHMSIPPDLSQENFRVFSSVEKSKLPYSQLGLVISSFHQTIGKANPSRTVSMTFWASTR